MCPAADVLKVIKQAVHQSSLAVRLCGSAEFALLLVEPHQFSAQLDECLAGEICAAIITRIGLNPAITGDSLGRGFPGTLT